MVLVILIDLIAILGLVYLSKSRQGLENSLPFATFLIVLIPIESLLPAGFFTLTTHRVIIGTLVVLYFAGAGSADRSARRGPTPLKMLLIVNAVWYIVATAFSIDPLSSVKKAVSAILEFFVLYFVYVKTISRVETVQRIILAIPLAIVVCCVLGVAEATQGWAVLNYFPAVSHHWAGSYFDRDVRIQSTYDHPILYGAALAMAIVVTLYCLTVVTRRSHKIILWAGLLLMFYNIYKTTSRGPWLDTILGCLLLMVFGKGKVRKTLMYIVTVSVLVLVLRPGVWGTISGLYDNTFSTDTSTGTSYAYRNALLQAAVQRLTTESGGRFFWGFGPETFYDVRLQGDLVGKPHVFLSCDNSWVQFMVETGFIGLAIMLLVLIKPALTSLKQFWKLPAPGRYLSLTIFIVFAIWYFQMYSVSMYSWGQTGYTLWIFIALTYAYGRIMKRQAAALPVTEGSTIEERTANWFGSERVDAGAKQES
jgi:hypothetical protein